MHAIDRRNKIAQDLLNNGRVSTTELANRYEVSSETIRKDIAYLEKSGIAKKGYGGAVIASELNEQNFLQKSAANTEAKIKIARAAFEYIGDEDIVILDSGSTTATLARMLTGYPGLSVVTNSIPAASILMGRVQTLLFLGGTIHPSSGASIGTWPLAELRNVHADIAFIGTSGFAKLDGPCVESIAEGEMKRAMIEAANRAMLLADSSKTRQDAIYRFAPWNSFERLITDDQIGEESLARLRDEIHVEVVGTHTKA